ncbi:MAG: cation diffusion facilitator family transporter [Coriobacteriia bacterium]
MANLVSATTRHRKRLWITFGLTGSYFVVEVVGGIFTNSLALLADAAHMLTDVGGIGLALFAAWMSTKPATSSKTYGYYRVEILAALINGVVLFLLSFYILYEAYGRFSDPPEIASGPMMMVAAFGLVVNLIGVWLLRQGAQDSLNVRGAFLEVIGDLLGSLGVLVAGAVMWTTGWYYADPIFSVLIGLFILPRTWKLMTQAVNVLLESTPAHINLAEVERAMLDVAGVAVVHDLHVWTITSGVEALSAHVVMAPGAPSNTDEVSSHLLAAVRDEFKIDHVTIQVDSASPECSEMPF